MSDLNQIHPEWAWYNCFVSPVARQMTSNTVVAKRDVCKCVLLASQFKSSELLWLNL